MNKVGNILILVPPTLGAWGIFPYLPFPGYATVLEQQLPMAAKHILITWKCLLYENIRDKLHRIIHYVLTKYSSRNSKLEISTVHTKVESREPAYPQVLIQNKIDRQLVRSRESGQQTVRRLWGHPFMTSTKKSRF